MKTFLHLFFRLGSTAVVSALVIAVWSPKALGQGDDELKRRFVEEAPSQWKEYVRLSGELQGLVSVSHTGTINDYETRIRMEYKTNDQGKVLKVTTKDITKGKVEKDDEEVFGVNPRYAFTLLRKSPDSPWVITDLINNVGNGTDLGRVAFRLNDYLRCATYAVILDGESLAEMLHKPEFLIGHCRKIQTDGEELVEVALTYSKMDGKWKRLLKGRLLFDPNRYWCLRSGDIQVTGDFSSGTQTFRATQSDNAGALPPLARVYESDGDWSFSEGLKNRQRLRYETSLSQPTRLPADKEFTLSAFDLPEPPGFEDKSMPLYLWFGLAGIACLVMAAYFRFRKRRAMVKV